jgi:hypothetical protein
VRRTIPTIHAVVEIEVQKNGIWVDLPPEPWPQFVRLSRATPEKDVALLVGTLSSYGRLQRSAAKSAEELAATFPEALPGGFAVVGDGRTILPSCCCSLETWHDWLRVLDGGGTPWTGHDPAPLVEVAGGRVYVWSDGAMGKKPTSESPIVFTSEQFDESVRKAAADLQVFTLPLMSWLKMHAPRSASTIAEKFRDVFLTHAQ